MSAGLFNACCPDCGAELQIDESGNGTCTACAHTYLNRLGYLIPVEVDSGAAPQPARADHQANDPIVPIDGALA